MILNIPGFAEASFPLYEKGKDKEGIKKIVLRDTSSKRTLQLHIDYREQVPGSRVFSLFVPYWLINRSQMTMSYKNPIEKADDTAVSVNCMLINFICSRSN